MLYLAQVEIERRAFKRVINLRLLSMQQANHLWVKVEGTELISINIKQLSNIQSNVVLAKLNMRREILELQDALPMLPKILHNLSKQSESILKGKGDVDLWKKSLEFQAAELSNRRDALEGKEEIIHLKEVYLTKENVKLKHNLAGLKRFKEKLDQAVITLQSAWERIRLERIRLMQDFGVKNSGVCDYPPNFINTESIISSEIKEDAE